MNITGKMNNAGNTFVFDSSKGIVNLVQGTISGGTLQQSGTGALAINAPGGGGTFADGVTLDMDQAINNVQVFATGGLNVLANRKLTINATTNSALLTFNGGAQTLGGGGTVELAGAGGTAFLRPLSGATATIGQNITVRATGTGAMSGDVMLEVSWRRHRSESPSRSNCPKVTASSGAASLRICSGPMLN